MPDLVKVECSNPVDIRLKFQMEMSLHDWERFIAVNDTEMPYAARNVLSAVRSAIWKLRDAQSVEIPGFSKVGTDGTTPQVKS